MLITYLCAVGWSVLVCTSIRRFWISTPGSLDEAKAASRMIDYSALAIVFWIGWAMHAWSTRL